MADNDLNRTLEALNSSLQSALTVLNGSERSKLFSALHDSENLPEKVLYTQAAQTVDLIHTIRQLLEPRTVILADHFLGTRTCLATQVAHPQP